MSAVGLAELRTPAEVGSRAIVAAALDTTLRSECARLDVAGGLLLPAPLRPIRSHYWQCVDRVGRILEGSYTCYHRRMPDKPPSCLVRPHRPQEIRSPRISS